MALPNSTPIQDIPGVDAALLEGAAKNLDKGQLIGLSRGGTTPALQASEQKSIESAFAGSAVSARAALEATATSCCCCCTPCCSCTAAASIEPLIDD